MSAEPPGVLLAELTTLRVGGPAARSVQPRTEDELVAAVTELDRAGEPVLLVAGGSNLVVSDDGFAGTVVRVLTSGVSLAPDGDRVSVTAAAGEPWDALVARVVAGGLAGIESLSGIPGTVGATPVQNVGAYGQEVAQTVSRVRVLDRKNQRVDDLEPQACAFGYRTSRFKGSDRFVVLSVTFSLAPSTRGGRGGGGAVTYPELARALGVEVGESVAPAQVREAVLGLRRSKGMVIEAASDRDPDTVSVGSFFTNPFLAPELAATLPADAPRYPQPDGTVKVSAAWLIEHAGFHRGYAIGPAAVSSKHTLALTNTGGATTADILALARAIAGGVRGRFGVELVPEPRLVGCAI